MNYVIPGSHIKVIARAVNALSKIGDEVFVSPLPDGLALKTLNSAKSSYGSFKFKKSFFSHHSSVSNAQGDQLSCKILMKSVCSVFKLSQALEKYVEKCEIKMADGDDTITFRLYCRYGNIKTYNVNIIENDGLESYNDEERTANYISTTAKIFNDAMQNFLASQDDITLVISQDAIKIKNYVQDEPDAFKAVHTELLLYKHEFESYNVSDKGEITFCLKEFRAFLSFCDYMKINVSARFDGSGKPVIFSSEYDKLNSLFVLSTMDGLDDVEESAPSRLGTSQIISNPVTPTNSQAHRRRPSNEVIDNRGSAVNSSISFSNNDGPSSMGRVQSQRSSAILSSTVSHNTVQETDGPSSVGRVRSQRPSALPSSAASHNTVQETGYSNQVNGNRNASVPQTGNSGSNISRCSRTKNDSSSHSNSAAAMRRDVSGFMQGQESNSVPQPSMEDLFGISGDVIPESPPPVKKMKRIFQRCFDLTLVPSEIPGCSQVMAGDSDEDG